MSAYLACDHLLIQHHLQARRLILQFPRGPISPPWLTFDTRSLFARKKPGQELSKTGPKFHEATQAEEDEEFTLVADVFAPQHNKRLPRGTAQLGKRVNLTAADKKKVDKASIGLPIPRTLKFFTYNCNPFILESCIPLEDIRTRNLGQLINNRINPGFNTRSEARPAHLNSSPGIQQRTSLGGTTLCSIAGQEHSAAPRDLVPGPPEDLQNAQISNNTTSPVISTSHLNNIKPELVVKVYTWLENVSTPVITDLGFPNFVSSLGIKEEVWSLIERSVRERKSRLRPMPNMMSTESNNNSVRGSNNPRLSGSYSCPSESRIHTNVSTIKDHPGTSARRPKSMPSGSQLPSCWNDEMDGFICHMEAQCEFSIKSIVRALKQRFAELREVSTALFSLQSW